MLFFAQVAIGEAGSVLKTSNKYTGKWQGLYEGGCPWYLGSGSRRDKACTMSSSGARGPVRTVAGPKLGMVMLARARDRDIGTDRAETVGPYGAPVGMLQWKESPCKRKRCMN